MNKKSAFKESMPVIEVANIASDLLEDIERRKLPYIQKKDLPAVSFAIGRLIDRLVLRAEERQVPVVAENGNGAGQVQKIRCNGRFATIKNGKCSMCGKSHPEVAS